MSRHAFRLAPVAMFLVAVGCGSDPIAPADPRGTYTLSTVNGRPLPGVVSQTTDYTMEVLAGTLTLTADHRFAFSAGLRTTLVGGSSAETTEVVTGSWMLRATTVGITFDQQVDIGTNVMTWDGRKTLTIRDPYGSVPVTMVFTR